MLGQPQPNGLIGESAVFREMLAAIAKIASYDATVLISGETGSGKELAARAIHYQGKRSDKPFIPVNCGALRVTVSMTATLVIPAPEQSRTCAAVRVRRRA